MNAVTDVPDNFKQWVRDNSNRIITASEKSTLPYFLRDNFGIVHNILNPQKKLKPIEIATEHHAAGTPEDIGIIQTAWNKRRLSHTIANAEELGMLTSPYYTKAVNEMRSAIENNDVSLFDKLLNIFRSNIQIATELEINATEELMNTSKFVVNNLELSKLFGSRGKAMAFKPANERRGNPNYSKSEAYKNNCQSCVLANELRRRGFDVEALPFGSQASLKLARHTELAFLNKEGHAPTSTPIKYALKKVKLRDGTSYMRPGDYAQNHKQIAESVKWAIAEIGDGRYHLKWASSSDRGCGHIITAEKIGPIIRFYDPQNGKVINNISAYMSKMDIYEGANLLKVDNLRINPEVAKSVIQQSRHNEVKNK